MKYELKKQTNKQITLSIYKKDKPAEADTGLLV